MGEGERKQGRPCSIHTYTALCTNGMQGPTFTEVVYNYILLVKTHKARQRMCSKLSANFKDKRGDRIQTAY